MASWGIHRPALRQPVPLTLYSSCRKQVHVTVNLDLYTRLSLVPFGDREGPRGRELPPPASAIDTILRRPREGLIDNASGTQNHKVHMDSSSLIGQNGYIAQWLEQLTADQHVPGSNLGMPFRLLRTRWHLHGV